MLKFLTAHTNGWSNHKHAYNKCGSKAFQVYFDDAKDSSQNKFQESRAKQVSRIKELFNQVSRIKIKVKIQEKTQLR